MDNRGVPGAGGFDAREKVTAGNWQSRDESANGNPTREEVAEVARSAETRSAGVRNLGGQALSGNIVDFAVAQQERLRGMNVARNGSELAQDRAELELAEAEVERPGEFVGALGSEVLQTEWTKDDQEDDQDINGRAEIPFVGRIVQEGVQEVTKNTVNAVDEVMKQKEFSPAQLVELWTEGSGKALSFLGRRVGDRNVPKSDNNGGAQNVA